MVEVFEIDNLVVSIPQDVLFQEVGNETVILSIESGNYFGLNELASRIWALLQEGQPMTEIIATLVREYEVSEECLRADFQRFISVLHSKGLIRIDRTHEA